MPWLAGTGSTVSLTCFLLIVLKTVQTTMPQVSSLNKMHRTTNIINSVVHSGYLSNKNATIPLDSLKRIFENPNCSDDRIICHTLFPAEVSYYLKNQVNQSVERLCLIIKPANGLSFSQVTIHLESLITLQFLKKLWIIPEHFTQGTVSRINQVRIFYPSNFTQKMPLEEVHVNLPIHQTGSETFAPFLQTLDKLQVLNLAYTLKINANNQLYDIIRSLEGKQIIALSLRSFQSIAFSQENFTQYLNTTNLLWPLEKCPLQYLDLSQNDLLEIIPGIYTVTKNIRILDISHNNLISTNSKAMWTELLLHPNVEILNVNHQGCPDSTTTMQQSSLQESRKWSTMQLLNGSFLNDFIKCKHKLGINDTEEKVKHYFCELLYCADPLYLKGIPCAVLPSWDDLFPLDFSCRFYVVIPVAKNLKELYAANINQMTSGKSVTKDNVICVGVNSVEKITLSNNTKLLQGIHWETEMKYTSFRGLERVTHFDLRNNGLQVSFENIKHMLANSFQLLQYLYLGGNLISINHSSICESHLYLKLLDLSHNNLRQISLNLKRCHHLEELDVSQNNLEDLDNLDFTTISFIKGSHNRITKLGKPTILTLKHLGAKLPLHVDLSDNPWDCGCSAEAAESIEFMQEAYKYNITFTGLVNYQCYGVGGYSLLNEVNVSKLRHRCFPSKLLIYIQAVTVTTSLALLILTFYLCYRCRYRINTCYYHTCRRIHQSQAGPLSTTVKYDAFVSYAADDRFWVHDVLKSELEGNCGLNLCLHYRDFPACGDLADVIVDKISQSNSIVVVLSRFSVVRPWCDYELKSAHAQHLYTKKKLIIIKLGDIPNDLELTYLVQDLLNSKVYVEWPDVGLKPSASDKRRQAVFWSKIQKEIYGQDYCSCFRYCNPCYKKNDPLYNPLLQETE